jgi:hypothetical protein
MSPYSAKPTKAMKKLLGARLPIDAGVFYAPYVPLMSAGVKQYVKV